MRLGPRIAIVAAAALALIVIGVGVAVSRSTPNDVGPMTVEIRIHYSHYEPARLTVLAGRPIRFVIRNDDPIEHEWIVGNAALHAVHRTGTELHHGDRPTEVSIPALTTVTTVVTFPVPDTLQYICHLPGHEAYGMVGFLDIR